jgi:hypothetical protein
MKYPKCLFEQADNRTECSNCGLFFSKWKKTPDINPSTSPHKKPAIGFLAIALLFFGLLAVAAGAVYFSLDKAATDKTETAATPPTELTTQPEEPIFEEIERKPLTPFQKKEAETSTLTENCKQGIIDMGGAEEDIKAHCY